MNAWFYSGLFGYGALLVAAGAALFRWRSRSRTARPPVEFKLVRGPGELSLRRIRAIDLALPLILLLAVAVPLLGGLGLFALVLELEGVWQIVGAVVAGLGFLTGAFFSGRLVWQRLVLRRELELSYLGERAVAEELAPLTQKGFRLFHDVSVLGPTDRVDLDHVLVGPTGVVAIETETRRRRRAQPEPRQHEVSFDGKQLMWPWGADRDTVADVETGSLCLAKWLLQNTGLKLSVHAVLVLPGWWVDSTGTGFVTVANHKQVLQAVGSRGEATLSNEQVEQIARLLEGHCRDVEA